MPALVEQHSLDPELVTFHRVLTKRQIQEITSLGIPFLQQAAFRSGNIKEDSVGSFKIRSSYTAWLQEDTHPVLKNLNKKISALTGLHLNDNKGYSEALQLNVYGAGGYYSPHVDAFNLGDEAYNNTDDVKDPGEIAERREGDRIATVMFYMNDVEAGGYTAFPRIGVGVKPTEGSAVFWTNLLSDGSTDVRTLHGACPVLKGIKWGMY
ncbi:hypothetical protein SK128_025146 [Halocaridina rubra]|uniref:Fe2OG dioxygenase domain-containing protein n=1 Tax=Halocaridina rubra TaxID=373956 RepID=A0AAN8WCT6_HALRR